VSLRFLIADTYYPAFLETFHGRHPELAAADYEEALEALMATCFGTSDFYSKNLRLLGREALDVVANDRLLQEKWAAEHRSPRTVARSAIRKAVRKTPWAGHFEEPDWKTSLLARRIRAERPDVLYFQNLALCEPQFIDSVRRFVKLIVGQIACLPPPEPFLRGCDLIVTSYQPFVERFRNAGITTEYLGFGFESTILDRLVKRPETYDTAFVGGFASVHARSTAILEAAAREIELDIWGYGTESLAPESPLLSRYHGEAWGIRMYDVLFNSRIAVNRHGLVESEREDYGNNMRLYEATGVGAMLLTEETENLGELFEVGSEVVSYAGADDLVEKIGYYLAHEHERREIAEAGQRRTLRDYTYSQRMKELTEIVEAYL
jgi:spore maturation protein CgeB